LARSFSDYVPFDYGMGFPVKTGTKFRIEDEYGDCTKYKKDPFRILFVLFL
jgi:hypothetical protein